MYKFHSLTSHSEDRRNSAAEECRPANNLCCYTVTATSNSFFYLHTPPTLSTGAADSKWTEFTTQKRRELVGLQSIVDDRGRMLGTEYDFSEKDHAELENAIATAARNPETVKKEFDDDHAAAMFGGARKTQSTRAHSPRESEHSRGSRGHSDRGHHRMQGRQRERSDRDEYHRSRYAKVSKHADRRDRGRNSEDQSRDIDRRWLDRDPYERSQRRSHSRSQDRSASPDRSRHRDRHSGYSRSRYERGSREDRGHGRERGEARRRHGSPDEPRGEQPAHGRPSVHRKSGHDSQRSGTMASRDSEVGTGVQQGVSRSGRPHEDGGATGGMLPGAVTAAGTARAHPQAVEPLEESNGGASVPAWEGLVPDGAIVVEFEEATREEPEERHADLDVKFQSLAKSSWRDRLAARS